MIGKIFVVAMIVVLVVLVYQFVQNLWTIDICVSYYQRYGNYSYTVPLTDNRTTTWDCYHKALNDISIYMAVAIGLSIFLGLAVRDIKD